MSLQKLLLAPFHQRVLAIALSGVVLGCASHSQFVPGGETSLALPNPQKNILIIFLHGSIGDMKQDNCQPNGGFVFGGVAVPPILKDLAHRDPNILIYAHCSRLVGDPQARAEEKIRLAPCQRNPRPYGLMQNKECKRAAELKELIGRFLQTNRGLSRERIFLAGTSSGAWTSLLALRQWPSLANAVIGFAPAFNGHFADRVRRSTKTEHMCVKCRGINKMIPRQDGIRKNSGGERIRYCHVNYIVSGRVPALLFAFGGDPYEDPETLKPFANGPGIRLVTVPTPPKDMGACSTWSFPPVPDVAHRCNHRKWFSPAYYGMIRSFIACRVASPHRRCH